MTRGFSRVELLVVVALLGLLASFGLARSTSHQDQLQLESGVRRLRVGLDRGRRAALIHRAPCADERPLLLDFCDSIGGLVAAAAPIAC